MTDILGMSMSNLWRRKMRSFLTVLGVIIGTVSIVVMLSLGFGLREATMKELETAGGLTEIMVYSDDYGSSEGLLDDSTLQTFSELDYVENVEPVLSYGMPVQAGKYEGYFEIMGVSRNYMSEIELEQGELPGPGAKNLNILVGNQVVTNFVDTTTGEEVMDYETMEMPDIDLMKLPVVGGLEVEDTYTEEPSTESDSSSDYYDSTFSDAENDFSDESSDFEEEEDSADVTGDEEEPSIDDTALESDFPSDFSSDYFEEDSSGFSYFTPDMKRVQVEISGITQGGLDVYTEYSDNCYVDIDALKDFLKKNYSANSVIPEQPTDREGKPYKDLKYSSIIVNVDKADNVEEVLENIQKKGYSAEANKEWLEQAEHEFMIIEAVLGGIGAVAMLVAAISIANTMTMSIYERTKEIGVMKVLGCSLGNIRSMFLSEAAFIGFLGGVIGIALSYLLSVVVNQFISPMLMEDYEMGTANISVIPPWLALAAIVFAAIIGMLAGFFPAQRATRLSPLAAIRNE